MKPILSPSLVKRSLASHSWLGLLAGALLYFVCLSGTLAVFYQEFERWEQPVVAESNEYNPDLIDQAYRKIMQSEIKNSDAEHQHYFILLPTDAMPRTRISSDTGAWFINSDGSIGDTVQHDWTTMLVNLHLYMHLPFNVGLVVVSILGALLCGLIVSGFLAHPRIFKDAFRLRLGGPQRLEQADIHNRLSVWGAPFYLMIAITGAYFGLASIINLVIAAAFFDGEEDAIVPTVFGAEPVLQQPIAPAAVGLALERMADIAPDTEPFYVTLEDAGTSKQYMIVGAQHAGRLIYAEQYRFDSAGNYLDKVGFSDGAIGRQVIFSVYRLHFGQFGGFAVKVLYFILGLALTVVSVTGINIWLARRKTRDTLNSVWAALVWGTPVALVLGAIGTIIFQLSPLLVFWAAVVVTIITATIKNNDVYIKNILQRSTGLLLLTLIAAYSVKFGEFAFAVFPLGVNVCLSMVALTFFLLSRIRSATE